MNSIVIGGRVAVQGCPDCGETGIITHGMRVSPEGVSGEFSFSCGRREKRSGDNVEVVTECPKRTEG